MHNEVLNGQPPDDLSKDASKKSDKKLHNGNRTTVPVSNISMQIENLNCSNGMNTNENETLAVYGDSASLWKASSRRCSSDGALKAMQGNLTQKPERGHSFSDSDEKTAALKAKINEKYDQLEMEMAAKASANGLTLRVNSPPSEAVLQLGDRTAALISPDPR